MPHRRGFLKTHPNDVHKLIVDILRLHLLANEFGHSSEDGIDGGGFTVPSDKRRNPSAVVTS